MIEIIILGIGPLRNPQYKSSPDAKVQMDDLDLVLPEVEKKQIKQLQVVEYVTLGKHSQVRRCQGCRGEI